jgi:hypothetical protein
MTQILRFWRDKPLQEKKQIMQSKSITAINFEQIKTVYAERGK